MSLAWESVTPRPLPLPLGEVAERSEDGEGKQRRAASLCEAAQCSHWVVRRSVAEVSRRSRDGGIVLAGGAELRLYTRFFGGRFVGGDAHIAPPRPQARKPHPHTTAPFPQEGRCCYVNSFIFSSSNVTVMV